MGNVYWLPGVLRAAGLTVIEHAGWQGRGVDFNPGGIIVHETQGSKGSSESGEINVLINGHSRLAGPISQAFVGRDGRWHIIAAGRCNHVKVGIAGPFKGVGNSGLMGVELHWTPGDPPQPAQYQAAVRGFAAIIKHTGWRAPVGHREHQPGEKTDPAGFDVNQFRRDVAAGAAAPITPGGIFTMGMLLIARDPANGQHWLCDGMTRRPIPADHVPHLLYLGRTGALSVWTGTTKDEAPASVWKGVDNMLGLPVGTPAPVALKPEDVAAIADQVAGELPANLITTDDLRTILSSAVSAITP